MKTIVVAFVTLVVGVLIGVSAAPEAEVRTRTVTETETETVEVEVTPQACADFADIAAESEDAVRDAGVTAVKATKAYIDFDLPRGNRIMDKALAEIDVANALDPEWRRLRDECVGGT